MLIAIGYVLPMLTGQIKQIGHLLLPMHIPVMLAGLLLGAGSGAAVGAILPITRSLIFTMPAMYPDAVAMSFELACYGLCAGIMARLFKGRRGIVPIYISLAVSMLIGRAVWGGVMSLLMSRDGKVLTFAAFTARAFVNGIPGIVLQLVLLPPLVYALRKIFGKKLS